MGVTKEKSRTIRVKCPNCKNRLFDMNVDAEGIINIKCVKCGTVSDVSMHHKNYRCRRQIVTQA